MVNKSLNSKAIKTGSVIFTNKVLRTKVLSNMKWTNHESY